MPTPDERDKLLFQKISGGDQESFTQLFQAHQAKLFTFAKKLTRSEVFAQEIVQDVFLNIWIARGRLGEVNSPGAYMNRIARNLSFNMLKRVAKDALSVGSFEDDYLYPDDSTQDLLDFKDSQALVQSAIIKLPQQQKLVYQLCRVEGLSYEQAAERLAISSSTVHFHMKEALRNIRSYLKRMGIPIAILTFLIR